MDDSPIISALNTLREKFPDELVQIWVEFSPKKGQQFTARIGDEIPTFTLGQTPAEAVNKLINKVNGTEAWRKAKIQSLKEELARMEAQI